MGTAVAALIAHAGGWDEILIPVAILGFLGYWLLRNRRVGESDGGGEPARGPSTCAYCDARIAAGVERCPTCGFRVRTPKVMAKA